MQEHSVVPIVATNEKLFLEKTSKEASSAAGLIYSSGIYSFCCSMYFCSLTTCKNIEEEDHEAELEPQICRPWVTVQAWNLFLTFLALRASNSERLLTMRWMMLRADISGLPLGNTRMMPML
jgi:hypothetical protein